MIEIAETAGFTRLELMAVTGTIGAAGVSHEQRGLTPLSARRHKAGGSQSRRLTSPELEAFMSLLSKITLGFVFIAALLFWYLGMRTLKTHEAWRKRRASAHALKIEEVEKKTTTVMEGEPGKPSMGQIRVNLDAAIFGRGKAWMDTSPRASMARAT